MKGITLGIVVCLMTVLVPVSTAECNATGTCAYASAGFTASELDGACGTSGVTLRDIEIVQTSSSSNSAGAVCRTYAASGSATGTGAVRGSLTSNLLPRATTCEGLGGCNAPSHYAKSPREMCAQARMVAHAVGSADAHGKGGFC